VDEEGGLHGRLDPGEKTVAAAAAAAAAATPSPQFYRESRAACRARRRRRRRSGRAGGRDGGRGSVSSSGHVGVSVSVEAGREEGVPQPSCC